MNRKALAGVAISLATIIGVGSSVAAGEVNGNGKTTPAGERAKSACAFSGLEDGLHLIGFDEDTGAPILETVDTGPGLVQNPHMENAAGVILEPGIPGFACRGNTETDL